MEITITGQHLDVTESMKTHINEKLESIQKRFPRVTQIRVSLHLDNNDQVAEANVHIDGIEIHASGVSTDMYHSIDLMIEKIMSQMTKHKEKLIDSHR